MTKFKIRIYKLTNGSYQISFNHPITGNRKRYKFNSLDEATKCRDYLEKQYEEDKLQVDGGVTVKDLIKIHLKKVPNSKLISNKKRFNHFFREFSNKKINEITKTDVMNWFDKLQKRYGYYSSTMVGVKTQINYLFNFAIDEGYIERNPTYSIFFTQKCPKMPRVVLNINEVESLVKDIKAFSPDELYPIIYTLMHTGARRGEILNAKWEHLDLKKGLIHITKTKNGEPRSVRMSDNLKAFISKQERRNEEYVFTLLDGRPAKFSSVERRIRKFKDEHPSNYEWNCHTFRHSFAYNFLKSGGQMYELQAILGHKNISITIDIYGHIRSEDVTTSSPYSI